MGIGYLAGGAGQSSLHDHRFTRTITGWTVSRQWRRDGANIAGATGFILDISREARGARIDCLVTVEGVTAASNEVTVA